MTVLETVLLHEISLQRAKTEQEKRRVLQSLRQEIQDHITRLNQEIDICKHTLQTVATALGKLKAKKQSSPKSKTKRLAKPASATARGRRYCVGFDP